MKAKSLGFNLWEISVPGQLLKIHIEAETEEEALKKGAKGQHVDVVNLTSKDDAKEIPKPKV